MAVELRIGAEHCECDWGVITHPVAEKIAPGEVEVAPLLLAATDWIDMLIASGEPDYRHECVNTAQERDGRKFFTAEAKNGRWTWELFPAFWWDGLPSTVYVGRWPD